MTAHLAGLPIAAAGLFGGRCLVPEVPAVEEPTVPLGQMLRLALAASDPLSWTFTVHDWTLEVYESGRCCVLDPDGLDVLAAWRLPVAVELLAAKAGIA